MSKIASSELIINDDGSIYHLNIKPEQLAKDIIFVGDPDRVDGVTKYFDSIEFSLQKREFKTTTGSYRGKRISVVSTGIGTDNIDIVLNELDALVNIDFDTREVKSKLTSLNIVRIGTSGSLQKDIPVDSFLISTHGLGLDGMIHAYLNDKILDTDISNAFIEFTGWNLRRGTPYVVEGNPKLIQNFYQEGKTHTGITATANGFYGPQGRKLRLDLDQNDLNQKIDHFQYQNHRVTNLEMETAAIYGLSALLGHKACSMNALLANRATGEFSRDYQKTVDSLIQYTLERFLTIE